MGGGVSTEVLIQDEEQIPQNAVGNYDYEMFSDFPEPGLLRMDQIEWNMCKANRDSIVKDEKGIIIPHPPSSFKEDIFYPDKLAEIDRHAVHCPPRLRNGSFEDLVRSLLKPCRSSLHRARVIFRWIAAQDLSEIKDYSGATPDSPMEYLKDIRNYKRPYSELVQRMYDTARIPCKTIKGRVKAARYERGDPTTTNFDATWNAVLIDQDWRLLDLNWACRSLRGQDLEDEDIGVDGKPKKSSSNARVGRLRNPVVERVKTKGGKDEWKKLADQNTVYGIVDEDWFITDPYIFIYLHFPEDPLWQLQGRMVTEEEWYDMVYLTPHFFNLRLDITSHEKVNVDTVCGCTEVLLKLPKDEKRHFDYRVFPLGKAIPSSATGGLPLTRFVYLDQSPYITQTVFKADKVIEETSRDNGTLEVYTRFPAPGTYLLSLFGKDPFLDAAFKEMAGYVIHCHSPKIGCQPFPRNPKRAWGPMPDALEEGLEPMVAIKQETGTVETDTGEVEIKFKLKTKAQFELTHTFESNNLSQNQLQGHVMYHYTDDEELIFNVRVPEPGEFALCIFMKKAGKKQKNVCNYLVYSTARPLFNTPFPVPEGGKIGVAPAAALLSLHPENHKGSYFEADNLLDLEFSTSIPAEFQTKLLWQKGTEPSDFSEYVFTEYLEETRPMFHLKFNRPGNFIFMLYGRERGVPQMHKHFLTYAIEVKEAEVHAIPYPELGKAWAEGFSFDEPIDGIIPEGSSKKLVINAPPGTTAVMCGGLQFTEVEPGKWEAVLDGEVPGDMKVTAKQGNQIKHICTFKVPTKAEEAKRKQEAKEVKAFIATCEREHSEQKAKHEREKEDIRKQEEKQKEEDKVKAEQAEEKREEQRLKAFEAREKLAAAVLHEGDAHPKVRELNKQMQRAVAARDHDMLVQLVRQYKEIYGGEVKTELLQETENAIKVIEIEKALEMATRDKRYHELKAAMEAAKHYGLVDQLKEQLADAEERMEHMEKLRKMSKRLKDMNNMILQEVKGYTSPPKLVHEVVKAALLLLCEHEGRTKNWKNCVRFITFKGPDCMKSRISEFDASTIHPEIWARVRELLLPYDVEEVAQSSVVVAAMFQWAYYIIADKEEDFQDEYPPSADVARQKEIFGDTREDDYD